MASSAACAPSPWRKQVLQHQLRMDPEVFDKALEKLWIHGGALVDFAENVSRGHDHWREPYIAQGDQKQQQLDLMLRYAESSECRMAGLVRHFGDLADAQQRLRHLRFLRSRRMRRPALSSRHRCGARRGALRGRHPAFERRAIHRQTARRSLPARRDDPRRLRGDSGRHGARQFPPPRQRRL